MYKVLATIQNFSDSLSNLFDLKWETTKLEGSRILEINLENRANRFFYQIPLKLFALIGEGRLSFKISKWPGHLRTLNENGKFFQLNRHPSLAGKSFYQKLDF